MRRLLTAQLAVSAAVVSSCCLLRVDAPASLSPPPRPRAGAPLEAGFARVDITPPPGVGIAGAGTESPKAEGYRLRLYARALVLADNAGNRLAIVVADLPLSSALLHRRVAAQTARTDGIGVDRLVVAATHTHSGPGHFFEASAYNDQASQVVGYDSLMLDSLATRLARAVHAAVANLRRARVAWQSRPIWGYTRIRSVPAMLRNIPLPTARQDAPTGLLPEYRLVDPDLTMLRVDWVDSADHHHHWPAGAFSIFAMHPTGNATTNALLDPDIHGIVERRLERHIDSLNRLGDTAFVPHAFHLFAQGNGGDVSPAWPPQSRCARPTLVLVPALDGPFTRSVSHWRPPTPRHVAACEHAAREAVAWIGQAVGDSAIALFDTLGHTLMDSVELARAFVTLSLRDSARVLGICAEPAVGMSAFAGADDFHSRVEGLRLFGVFPLGLEQGSTNPDAPGCQAQKRKFFDGWFGDGPNRAFVSGGLPSYAQISVLQIGDRLIGTLPAEPTTMAARRMRQQMMDSAPGGVKYALIMGLTNGYMEYVATAEEYTAQYYEGGSTLYGPGEAAMFGRTLAHLAANVTKGDSLPPSHAMRIVAQVGHQHTILRRRRPEGVPRDTIDSQPRCSGDTVYARVGLGDVGDWVVTTDSLSRRPRVEVVRDDAALSVVSRDDDPQLELRFVEKRDGRASWQLRWSGAHGGRYRVRIPGRPASDSVADCALTVKKKGR